MLRHASDALSAGIRRFPWVRRLTKSVFVQRAYMMLCGCVRMRPFIPAYGFRLEMQIWDPHVLREIRETGAYEPVLSARIHAHVTPGMNVCDVGANAGYFSILAARRAAPGGRVFAFEPDARCQPVLRRNLESNGLTNVTVIPAVVDERPGRVALHCGWTSAVNSVSAGNVVGVSSSATVESVTLDGAGLPPLGLLKMDVQGAEFRCLRGAEDVLRRSPGVAIAFEFWPQGLRNAGEDPAAMLKWLGDRGFVARGIRHPEWNTADMRPEDIVAAVDRADKELYDRYEDFWATRA